VLSQFRAAGRRSAQASGLCYPSKWPPLLRSSGSILDFCFLIFSQSLLTSAATLQGSAPIRVHPWSKQFALLCQLAAQNGGMKSRQFNRRDFIRATATASAGARKA
jgi:hypothetical protein